MKKQFIKDEYGEFEWIDWETFEGERIKVKKYRNPYDALKGIEYSLELTEKYKDSDLEVRNLEHVKKNIENIYSFANNPEILQSKKISALKRELLKYSSILKELERSKTHTSSFDVNGEYIIYHRNELEYYIEKIDYLVEFLSLELSGQDDNYDLIKLKKKSHRIILLEEMGIIDFLEKKYTALRENKTKLATIIEYIQEGETSDIHSIENIRKSLSYLNTGHKRDPKTKEARNAVEAELKRIGLL